MEEKEQINNDAESYGAEDIKILKRLSAVKGLRCT